MHLTAITPCHQRDIVAVLFPVFLIGQVSATAQDQPASPLQQLTVPIDRLPSGCSLNPPAPGVPGRFTANPWMGTDRGIVAGIRRQIDGEPSTVDGPPLSAREARRFFLRLADGIDQAYAATYDQPGVGEVNVYAVEFGNQADAVREPIRKTIGTRIVLGKVVAVIRVRGTAEQCFDAVRDHVQRLR